MKKVVLASVFLLISVFLVFAATAQSGMTARDIIERSDDLMRGLTSYSEMTMKITTPRYSRTVKMKAWTEGRDKSFIVVTAPARDAGVTFLKLGREMWNYRPDIERTIKIPPSMMLQSWMGSDFTNDELARADSMIIDYTHKIVEETQIDGVDCWKIELIPKPDAPVVWGKIVSYVSKAHAAEWSVTNLPGEWQPLIESARAGGYIADDNTPGTDTELQRFLDFTNDELSKPA